MPLYYIHTLARRYDRRALCGALCGGQAAGVGTFAWRNVTCQNCLKNEKIDLGDLDIRSTYTILTGKVERKE